MDIISARSVNRRRLFRLAGLTTAAAAAAAATASPAHAHPTPAPLRRPHHYDVIVVGAGFAGVTAARELRARGLRTLVLEARDRIGGRTWTDTFVGESIELGGHWISDQQQLAMRELERYGIPLVPDAEPDVAIFPTPDGFEKYDPEDVYGRVAELVEMLFRDSARYFPRPHDPLFRADLLARIDHLSLQDGIERLGLATLDEMWLDLTVAGFAGGSSSHGALTALAQWWALAGWNAGGWFGLMSHRPASGMAGLLHAMLDEQPVDVELGVQVDRVIDHGRSVRVGTCGGRVYHASHVVVAVPVNVWHSIQFVPGLPRVHTRANAEGIGVPETVKLWLHVRGVPETVIAEAANGAAISSLIPAGQLDDGQMLVGFGFDPTLDLNDHAAVEAAVQYLLPEAQLVDYRAHRWGNDPYALGAQALRQPGQILRQLPRIQQPHGRLAFASGDIASGWNGFVDGAIESGLRASRQVLAMAGKR